MPSTSAVLSICMILLQAGGMVLFFYNMITQHHHPQADETVHPDQRIREIVDRIAQLPMEEFVPLDEMASCKVSQLQQMLQARSPPPQLRNYNDTCCICCEDYQAGDALRILPHCRHEFHVDCVDQWAYTVANMRLRRQPTCPLCNTAL